MCLSRSLPRPVVTLSFALAFVIAVSTGRSVCSATEFEASVAPKQQFLLKIYPRFYFTSAYFDDDGHAKNLPEVTGLLYTELPAHLQYGVTGSLSLGAIVPFGWTYQEEESRTHSQNRVAVREIWLTLQHRWLTFPFVSSSSVRVKFPLMKKKDWEDGLRIGDNQIDIFPAYYFDYFSESQYWFVEFMIGYKYRFESEEWKPFDELRFYAKGGYELFADLKMSFFLFADLTDFRNGDPPEENAKFFHNEGSLHAFGYGISLWPRPTLRIEMATGGDWSGRHQYRGMKWTVGITKIL